MKGANLVQGAAQVKLVASDSLLAKNTGAISAAKYSMVVNFDNTSTLPV